MLFHPSFGGLPPWMSHMVFAIGLWLAPKLFSYYRRKGENVENEQRPLLRSKRTTLYGILTTQGFGLDCRFHSLWRHCGKSTPFNVSRIWIRKATSDSNRWSEFVSLGHPCYSLRNDFLVPDLEIKKCR